MLGGALALVALGSNVVGSAIPEAIMSGLMLVMALLLMAGTLGLSRRTRPGVLGAVGLVVAILGLVAMVAGIVLVSATGIEVVAMFMVLGVLTHPIGLLIYGISNLKAMSLPRWNALPLIMGLLAGPGVIVLRVIQGEGGFQSGQQADPAWGLWTLTIGVGWILLGYAIQENAPAPAQTTQPTV
jgi:hypothetical protein